MSSVLLTYVRYKIIFVWGHSWSRHTKKYFFLQRQKRKLGFIAMYMIKLCTLLHQVLSVNFGFIAAERSEGSSIRVYKGSDFVCAPTWPGPATEWPLQN